jgi:hypothetical protein
MDQLLIFILTFGFRISDLLKRYFQSELLDQLELINGEAFGDTLWSSFEKTDGPD